MRGLRVLLIVLFIALHVVTVLPGIDLLLQYRGIENDITTYQKKVEVFDHVVRQTFLPLITTFFGSVVAYVFTVGAAGVINNYNLTRSGQPPHEIKFF